MILRIIGTGLLLKAAIGVMAVAAGGAGVVLLACAAKRRAEARAAWPAEEDDADRAEE
jgi:hypothetical protein